MFFSAFAFIQLILNNRTIKRMNMNVLAIFVMLLCVEYERMRKQLHIIFDRMSYGNFCPTQRAVRTVVFIWFWWRISMPDFIFRYSTSFTVEHWTNIAHSSFLNYFVRFEKDITSFIQLTQPLYYLLQFNHWSRNYVFITNLSLFHVNGMDFSKNKICQYRPKAVCVCVCWENAQSDSGIWDVRLRL